MIFTTGDRNETHANQAAFNNHHWNFFYFTNYLLFKYKHLIGRLNEL